MSQHRHSQEWRAVGASCAAAIACSAATAQITWHVDDDCVGPGTGSPVDPFCAIQDAIDAASDFDDIVVAPGTYHEAIDLSGKAISVCSAAGAQTTIINATGLGQLSVVTFDAGEGPDPLLAGFTLTGGSGTDPGDGVRRGGGLALSGGRATVHNCRFGGNAAGGGGGLFTNGTDLAITNSVFNGNAADFSGGGLRSAGGCVEMINCTFTGNVALGSGAGTAVLDGTLTATNCILWGDVPDEVVGQGTVAMSFSDVQGGAAGIGNIDVDPLFVDADDLHLQDGSPCIDRGDDAVAGLPATDLDGEPRLQQCHVDIGADESPFFIDDDDNGIADCTTCPWDCSAVADGDVGIVDFLALLAQWGGPGACDSDGGGVGITDFLDLLANWGPCP